MSKEQTIERIMAAVDHLLYTDRRAENEWAEDAEYEARAEAHAALRIMILVSMDEVPPGWRLAPTEPTPEMELAGERAIIEFDASMPTWAGTAGKAYRAMLDASTDQSAHRLASDQ